MKIKDNNDNRLIVYFIYDRDGLVDRYILYMLGDLRKNAKELCVVVNGRLQDGQKEKLSPFADKVLERDNTGMDVWAYKEAMESYGWNALSSYDEIVLMNYTMMGPVYPFKEMFDAMSGRDLDFWGITKFHKTDFDPFGTLQDGYIPEHIQSHFISIRQDMVKSEGFQRYWDEMPFIKDYLSSVGYHESMFTKRFADQGFKWDVYCNSDDLEGYTYNPIMGAAVKMIRDKRCPIFKRRSFMQDYTVVLSEDCGQSAYELYHYLDRETDFDMDMFWENLLRLENMADLKKNLQLNYFLPQDQSDYPDETVSEKKLALVMHMYFPDLIDECFEYAQNMPANTDVYITTNTEEKKQKIYERFKDLPCHKLEITLVGNKGRDVAPFLVEMQDKYMNYDYICKLHDKKVGQLKPGTVGAAFAYRCNKNMLASRNFVKNVIKTFDENPHLGMLMPPPPNHAQYYIALGLEWGMNFDVTKELADKLGLHVNMNKKKEPISPLGGVFWFRPQALKILFDKGWSYDEFAPEPIGEDGQLVHGIERIYGFCVQNEGYYPAWLMNTAAAGMEVTNLHYMLRELNNVIFYKGNGAGSHNKVVLDLGYNLDELKGYRSLIDITGEPVNNEGKLYVAPSGRGYSEDASVSVVNEERAEKFTYVFEDLEEFGALDALRFDPSRAPGIVLKDMQVELQGTDGRIVSYGLFDPQVNYAGSGFRLHDKVLFMADDPQIYLSLEGIQNLSKVSIKTDVDYHVKQEDVFEIARLLGRGEKVSRMKFWEN